MFLSNPFGYLRRKIGHSKHPSQEYSAAQTNQNPYSQSASFPAMSGYPAGYNPYPYHSSQGVYADRHPPPWQVQQYQPPYPYQKSYPFAQGPPPGTVPHYYARNTHHNPYSQPPVRYQYGSHAHVAAPTPIRPSRVPPQSRHAMDVESHAPSASRVDISNPPLNRSTEQFEHRRRVDEEAHPTRESRRKPSVASSRPQRVATPPVEPPAPVANEDPRQETTNRTHGLLRELSSTPPFPTIEWNITHRVHHAVMVLRPGKKERLDLDKKAVVPGHHILYITTLKLSSPLQTVYNRWGPIILRPGKGGEGYTLGAILQAIHRYFNTYLTREEIKELTPEENMTMRASGSKRWRAAHDVDHLGWTSQEEDELLEDASKGYIRADFLEGHLHFAGLTMLSNFYESKTLFLTLETAPHTKGTGS